MSGFFLFVLAVAVSAPLAEAFVSSSSPWISSQPSSMFSMATESLRPAWSMRLKAQKEDDKDDADESNTNKADKEDAILDNKIAKALDSQEEAFESVMTTSATDSTTTANDVDVDSAAATDDAATDDDDSQDTTPKDEPKTSFVQDAVETIKDALPDSKKKENLLFLQSLGAITGRGEFANRQQHSSAAKVVQQLEEGTTLAKVDPELRYGRWELVYCSTQLFRSSPFFMAGRAVCQSDADARKYNWFCDMHRQALAISTIRSVRQIVTRTHRLVSEFEVSAGAIPFLRDFTPFSYSGGAPLAITGAIVSSADITWKETSDDGNNSNHDMELLMDTVEIKGSNIPGLRQVLDMDMIQLQSRSLGSTLERSIASYENPRPVFCTTYLDEQFRISRDQDDNIFCYIKTSDNDALTDYSDQVSDLGLTKLVEGFQSTFLQSEN